MTFSKWLTAWHVTVYVADTNSVLQYNCVDDHRWGRTLPKYQQGTPGVLCSSEPVWQKVWGWFSVMEGINMGRTLPPIERGNHRCPHQCRSTNVWSLLTGWASVWTLLMGWATEWTVASDRGTWHSKVPGAQSLLTTQNTMLVLDPPVRCDWLFICILIVTTIPIPD